MVGDEAQLYVGTYAEAGGIGLYPLGRDLMGEWTLGEPFPRARNASYGAYSPRFDLHYLVDEADEGTLGVLRHSEDGWQHLARSPTGGAQPCYVALDPNESCVAVANYGSGSVALLQLDPASGLPGDPVVHMENSGHGPVSHRQERPHAHCAVFSPNGNWLYQTDLGTDEVISFAFDADHVALVDRRSAFQAPPGAGPRHLVFHPHQPRAVLVSELASNLTMLAVGEGTLAPAQCVSTLPAGFEGHSLGGHVAINETGDRVYATNRGHDSIATFALDEGGRLSLLGHTPSSGESPRFFLLQKTQRRMLVANQVGNSVTVFDIAVDGTLTQCGEVAVAAPAFLFGAGSSDERT
jgi:6-phosphogluconolactonase